MLAAPPAADSLALGAPAPSSLAVATQFSEISPQKSAISNQKSAIPFDPLRLVSVLYRHRFLLLAALLLSTVVGYFIAWLRIEPLHTAGAQVIRHQAPNVFRASDTGDSFQPATVTLPILLNLMRSKTLIERTATALTQAGTPLTAGQLLSGLSVANERNSDLLTLTWNTASSPATAATVLNGYIKELISHTRQMQSADAAEINRYLKAELARVEKEIAQQNSVLLKYAAEQQIVDADKEITAALTDLGNYSLRYENLRLEHDTLHLKISAAEKEFAKASPAAGRVSAAQTELDTLLLRYTEENPLVITAREQLEALQKQLTASSDSDSDSNSSLEKLSADTAESSRTKDESESESESEEEPLSPLFPAVNQESGIRNQESEELPTSPVASSLYLELISLRSQKSVLAQQLQAIDQTRSQLRQKLEQLPRKALDYALLRDRRTTLESARTIMATRQREADLHEQNALGYCRQLSSARTEDVVTDSRTSKRLTLTALFGLSAPLLLSGLLLYRQQRPGTIHTPGDLRYASQLPVLATLPEQHLHDADSAQRWAFSTWTQLQSQLQSASGSVLLGLLTDSAQPAPLHLASLFAEAALWRNSPVLIIATHPLAHHPHIPLHQALAPQNAEQMHQWLSSQSGILTLTYSPDTAWTQAQRQHLQGTLQSWAQHPRAVIFFQLPPPSHPTTLLLAEQLPQLAWVSRATHSLTRTTAQQLKLYRQSGTRLVGSILHGAPSLSHPLLNRLAKITACLAFTAFSWAGEVPSSSSSISSSFVLEKPSVEPAQSSRTKDEFEDEDDSPAASPTKNQEPRTKNPFPYLTGPGDTFHLTLLGHPDSRRENIAITPSGHISYLQAQDIQVSGLSLPLLRHQLTAALSRYYKNPRLSLIPISLQNQRVYLLGKVIRKGALPMPRPLTILDAVSAAGGFETGLMNNKTAELADLRRAFLARGGQHIPTDFTALFQRGDTSQNHLLQPGDYLYFPPATAAQVQIFGNVKTQGTQAHYAHSSVTSVLTTAGGFTKRAYQRRVLIIRGSLAKPEAIPVDMAEILSGQASSTALQPGDILYVADKPWARAEQILDYALSAFVMGSVGTYANQHVLPIVTQPLFGQ